MVCYGHSVCQCHPISSTGVLVPPNITKRCVRRQVCASGKGRDKHVFLAICRMFPSHDNGLWEVTALLRRPRSSRPRPEAVQRRSDKEGGVQTYLYTYISLYYICVCMCIHIYIYICIYTYTHITAPGRWSSRLELKRSTVHASGTGSLVESWHSGLVVTPVLRPRNSAALRLVWYDAREMLRQLTGSLDSPSWRRSMVGRGAVAARPGAKMGASIRGEPLAWHYLLLV